MTYASGVPVGFLSGVTTTVSWLVCGCQVEGGVRVDLGQPRAWRNIISLVI